MNKVQNGLYEVQLLQMFKLINRTYQANKIRIHRLSKEGGWIVGGQIAGVLGSLALVRVLTEYLSPSQYGQLALGLTVAGLVNQIFMGGLTAGIGRYYSIASEKQEMGGYLHAARNLLVYATAAVVVVGFALIVSLQWLGYSQWIGLAVAALLFAVLSGYNSTLNSIQNAARQRAVVAFHSGFESWLRIILALFAMLWVGRSSTAVIIGYISAYLLIIFSQSVFLRRASNFQDVKNRNHVKWMSQIWTYSLPFTTWGGFTWMQQVSDRWALQHFSTTADVGQYSALFQLGFTPIALITSVAVSFISPILYHKAGDATDQKRMDLVHRLSWRIVKLSLAVTVAAFGISFLIHESLFSILVGAEYRLSSHLLPWMVLSGGLFSSAQLLATKLLSEMEVGKLRKVKIITSIGGTVINSIGAYFAGVQGVAVGLVVFSVLHLIWILLICKKPKMNELDASQILKGKRS